MWGRALFSIHLLVTKKKSSIRDKEKKIETYESRNGNPEEKNSTRAYSDMSREDAAAAGNRFDARARRLGPPTLRQSILSYISLDNRSPSFVPSRSTPKTLASRFYIFFSIWNHRHRYVSQFLSYKTSPFFFIERGHRLTFVKRVTWKVLSFLAWSDINVGW